MFGHMTGNLSNEPLAMVFGAWAWLQMVRLVRAADGPPTVRRAALLGLTLGLAALTRLTALLWLPAAVIALVFAARNANQSRAAGPPAAGRFRRLFRAADCAVAGAQPDAFGAPFLRTFDRPLLSGGASLADFLAGNTPLPAGFPVAITPLYTALWYASTAWLPFWLVQFYLPGFPQAAQAWQAVLLLVSVFALVALFLHASRTRRGEAGTAPDPAGRALLWAAGRGARRVPDCAGATTVVRGLERGAVGRALPGGRRARVRVAFSIRRFDVAAAAAARPLRKSRGYVAPAVLATILLVFDVYAVSLVRAFYRDNPQQADVQPITTQAAAPR
jgi:hypothetical protein